MFAFSGKQLRFKMMQNRRRSIFYPSVRFEALLGAIYLDKGYNTCQKFIYNNVIVPYVDIQKLEGKITSYKGLIIEWCQKQKRYRE